jgi:HSP20 family protein
MVVSVASHPHRFGAVVRQMMQWFEQAPGVRPSQGGPPGTWAPSMNLYEDSANYYAVADLAGVDPHEMEIRVEKDVLVLVGLRKTPDPPNPRGPVCLHLMEIDHGAFCRRLNLPPEADLTDITAAYRNGLLWICIPKKRPAPGAQPMAGSRQRPANSRGSLNAERR